MTASIINIILAALTLVVGFVATYFKANSKLYAKVNGLITAAESVYKDTGSGGQKFQWVIGQLYALIPAALRPFLPEKILAALVQNVFDQVAAYASKQLGKAAEAVTAPAAPATTSVTK